MVNKGLAREQQQHSETSADLYYQIFGKIMLKVKPNDLSEP